MVSSKARTVEEYLQSLPPERSEPMRAVREVILKNIPSGYAETMNWGMISYEIPLTRYPDTYNQQPLSLAGLSSQKNYMSLYLMAVYSNPKTTDWFHKKYRASGIKIDMGKSCVRFKKLDELPLDLIGETIALYGVEEYIELHEQARKRTGAKKG